MLRRHKRTALVATAAVLQEKIVTLFDSLRQVCVFHPLLVTQPVDVSLNVL